MKYYIVSLHESEVHIPEVDNWYKDTKVLDFFKGYTWKIPYRSLLFVKERSWEPNYLKMLFSPFPLIHESLLPAFEAYGIQCIHKQMVFLDIRYKRAELYYLLLLRTLRTRIEHGNGRAFARCGRREAAGCQAFYIQDPLKYHLICSLALTEALLRQGLTGIKLEPVELREEDI